MAKKSSNKKAENLSASEKAAIGIGLTTAAVAAAGYYFLHGSSNATKNRKTVKSWMLKAKAEVLEALESAEEMSEREFADLVKSVSSTYTSVKGATKTDLVDFKRDMMDIWKKIEATPAAKKAKKAAQVAAAEAAVATAKGALKQKSASKKIKKKAKKVAKKTAKTTSKKK